MKKIYDTLKTPFYDDLNIDSPWDEYPRPTLVRDSFLCLNGYWDFCECNKDFTEDFNEKILVPFPPESLLSGINRQIKENCISKTDCNVFNERNDKSHFGADW